MGAAEEKNFAAGESGSPRRGVPLFLQQIRRRRNNMSKKSNRINIPEAREAMDKFKMEAANEVGVNLKQG